MKGYTDVNIQQSYKKKISSNENFSTKHTVNKTNPNSKTYEITNANYIDKINKNIKISYPQIIYLKDISKQKLINKRIKNDILKVLNNYKSEKRKFDLQINYNIKLKSRNLLSILYTGFDCFSGYPRVNCLSYTENIDLNSVRKIRLGDLVNINKGFVKKLLDGKFKSLDYGAPSGLEEYDIQTMIEKLRRADLIEDVGTAKQSDAYSYLTSDSLGISIYVSHVAGDHREFEIKFKKIKDSIKATNPIWKYFKTGF